ncbi:MAG: hypothetical protein HOP31_09530 [Ignavibacteria bacterium]|nr:hypothetical protein [Ignavibacteria bacterium]
MNNTKLIRLFKTFKPAEFIEFGKFVNSPFHNESPKIISLYIFLKNYYPEFEDDDLTSENVYSSIYGEVKYDNKKMRDRFHDMLKLAEEYLAIVNLRKEKAGVRLNTLKEFSSRRLAVHFDKKFNEIKKILDNNSVKNENTLLMEYLNENEWLEFYENKHLLGKRKAFFDKIVSQNDKFLVYFVTSMLRHYSILNNIKGLISTNYEYNFYDTVMEYVSRMDLKKYPLIKALQLMIRLNQNRVDDNLYFELKKLYLKYYSGMEMYDRIMISTELFIHANIRYSMEKKGFDEELFDIIKLQLKHKTYPTENGWMKREQYFVCIDSAASIEKISWVESFIEEYTPKVVPELRENAYCWAKGMLYYYNNEYDEALKELSRVKTGDYFIYYKVKVLTSKIYLETCEYEDLFVLIDSFKHYTASNTLLPEYMKKKYFKYIEALNKLALLTINRDDYKLKKLIEHIKSHTIEQITSNKKWLLLRAKRFLK